MVKYVCSALLLMATSLSAAQLNDPTQPQLPAALLSEAGAHDQFTVSSIILRKRARLAIINEQPVREGEHVDGAYVARIEATRVRLVVAGEARWVTTLAEPSVKTKR